MEYSNNIIKFEGGIYPKFQSEGFASQFAIPYALKVCKGSGLDVGCNRKEWSLPGSTPVDPILNEFHAKNLPSQPIDYIFSSHCLEHLDDWVDVLEYWTKKIKSNGVLFLYLPDYSQVYWRPWNNRKHKNIFTPQILEDVMKHLKYTNIFKSGVDLNNSFMIFGYKDEK